MKHHQRLLLCLLGLLALGSCRPLFERQLAGRILALEGEAQGTSHGQTVRLTKSSSVYPGETITLASDSRLDLMLLPGVLLELAGGTEIEITQLRLTKNGDETVAPTTARKAGLRLRRGTLFASVGHAQRRSKLLVETSAGSLTAFDHRTCKIEVDGNRTRVMSVRGKAHFAPAGGGPPVKIGPGYFAEWPSHGGGPQAAADSGPEAQATVTQILGVEKRLVRFEKAAREEFAPWRP